MSRFITGESRIYPVLSGRVQWKKCLTDTFGSDFQDLLEAKLLLGSAIGSAARIFQAVIKAEKKVPRLVLQKCCAYFAASGGQQFISNAIDQLPELESLQPAMNEALRLDYKAALKQYEESYLRIKKQCNCSICKNPRTRDGYRFCFVLIMETIISLCQLLAGLEIAKDLYPKRVGIESIYQNQYDTLAKKEDLKFKVADLGPIVYVLSGSTFMGSGADDIATCQRLEVALQVFAGGEKSNLSNTSAQSRSGVVAYYDIHRNLSIDRENLGLVHVMPGAIEYEGRAFYKLQDYPTAESQDSTTGDELGKRIRELNDVSVEITETAQSLRVNYKLRPQQPSDHDAYVHILPTKFIKDVYTARGRVKCPRLPHGCQADTPNVTRWTRTEYPMITSDNEQEPFIVIECAEEDTYLPIAVFGAYDDIMDIGILTDGACLDCCLAREDAWFDFGNISTAVMIASPNFVKFQEDIPSGFSPEVSTIS